MTSDDEAELLASYTIYFVGKDINHELFIHADDSIYTIKQKIILSHLPLEDYSPHDLYLFAYFPQTKTLTDLYESLLDFGGFTPKNLYHLLLNTHPEEVGDLDPQQNYSLADLKKWKLDGTKNRLQPLGLRFRTSSSALLFPVNPMDVEDDPQPPLDADTFLPYNYNSELLLNYGKPNNNILYCVLRDEFSNNLIRDIYFEKETTTMDPPLPWFKSIDSVYKQPKEHATVYDENGITQFHGFIHAAEGGALPLESLFKQCHSTATVPFVAFHPGPQREPLIRLFANQLLANGQQIPVLSQEKINRMRSEIRVRTILLLFPAKRGRTDTSLIVQIQRQGQIHISSYSEKWSTPVPVDDLFQQIHQTVNVWLESAGIAASFEKTNINILYLDYRLSSKIKKPVLKYLGTAKNIGGIFEKSHYDAKDERVQLLYQQIENFTTTLDEKNNGFVSLVTMENQRGGNNILSWEIYGLTSLEYVRHWCLYVDRILGVSQQHPEIFKEWCRAPSRPGEGTVVAAAAAAAATVDPGSENEQNDLLDEFIGNTNKSEEKDMEDIVSEEDVGIIEDGRGEEDGEDGEDGSVELYLDNSSSSQTGGQKIVADEMYERNLVGKKVEKNAVERMRQYDPALFKTKTQDGKTAIYSRLCPVQRQPMVVTDEELAAIDQENPNSYETKIKYGTDPNKQFNYICPKFWCLKTNKPISEKDVAEGKCGKIIPENAKTIPEGHFVLENRPKTAVKRQYPGFLKDVCLPCCFAYDTETSTKISTEQQNRINQCGAPAPDDVSSGKKAQATTIKQHGRPEYIIGVDIVPLDKGRRGRLPLPLQSFFHLNYAEAINDKNEMNPTRDKTHFSTLVRYGVEQGSILGCLFDIYLTMAPSPFTTMKEFQQKILSNPTIITLDKFNTYFRGSLRTIFGGEENPKHSPTNLDKESFMYKNMKNTDKKQTQLFKDTVSAYHNYLDYLSKPAGEIDHTYIWDLFTDDNPNLLPGGVRLVMIEITQTMTEDITMLCPTSSTPNLDNKRIVIVLKRGNYYEPVYGFSLIEDDRTVTPTLTKIFTSSTTKNPRLAALFKILKVIEKDQCSSQPSLKTYNFTEPLILDVLLSTLVHFHMGTPKIQIVNYNYQVIGIMLDLGTVMIPCAPSPPSETIPSTLYINQVNQIAQDYYTTRDNLTQWSEKMGNKIRCKPTQRVVDDDMVVGILLETNQFVPINPPLMNETVWGDSLPTIQDNNHWISSQTNVSGSDEKKTKAMVRLQREHEFYQLFRNHIQDYLQKNPDSLEKIKSILSNGSSLSTRLTKVVEILHKQTPPPFFMDYPTTDENMEILNHHSKGIIFPKHHLITGDDNQIQYYMRVADEIVRNRRIQRLMLTIPLLPLSKATKYELNSDEILLLGSNLPAYLESIHWNSKNFLGPKIKTNYNTAEPAITDFKAKHRVISIEDQQQAILGDGPNAAIKDGTTCTIEKAPIQGNANESKWVLSFPKNTKEFVLEPTSSCSWKVLELIQQLSGNSSQIKSSQVLRTMLSSLYEKSLYQKKIMDVLRFQKKIPGSDTIAITASEMVLDNSYTITDLDIWMLADHYQWPVILFSSTRLKLLVSGGEEPDWKWLGGNPKDKYVFVRSPLNPEKNGYRIIEKAFAHEDLSQTPKRMGRILELALNQMEDETSIYYPNMGSLDEFLSKKLTIVRKPRV